MDQIDELTEDEILADLERLRRVIPGDLQKKVAPALGPGEFTIRDYQLLVEHDRGIRISWARARQLLAKGVADGSLLEVGLRTVRDSSGVNRTVKAFKQRPGV